MDISTQILKIQQKIKDCQKKYSQRNWEQIWELNKLWLELAYWQLVERGEIKLPDYLEKVKKSWKNLKEIKAKSGKWPRRKLKDFLRKQKKEYGELLVWVIEQQKEEKYLKFGRWLRKLVGKISKLDIRN